MKLGVFFALFGGMTLDEAIAYVKDVGGVSMVELGTGNYPGSPHLHVKELLSSKPKRESLKKKIADAGLSISALSCHGNPLHPVKKTAAAHQETARDTIRLAEKLGVKVVVDFSGCPGDSDNAKHPNWVTCPWPDDFTQVLEWQWEKKVIPYWNRHAKFAHDHGVKIGIEMHPGFVVYNPETLLRLRSACGKNIGANFDPSHLFWQGIDPIAALRRLRGAIFHVHAKDTKVDAINTAENGVLDTKHYGNEIRRSWVFRTVGYGHDRAFWTDFISNLRMLGYDGAISIEHEDSLMSVNEGLRKAVALLTDVLLHEKRGGMWWA
jgi:sugar phosphate isomerase/epimerase